MKSGLFILRRSWATGCWLALVLPGMRRRQRAAKERKLAG